MEKQIIQKFWTVKQKEVCQVEQPDQISLCSLDSKRLYEILYNTWRTEGTQ